MNSTDCNNSHTLDFNRNTQGSILTDIHSISYSTQIEFHSPILTRFEQKKKPISTSMKPILIRNNGGYLDRFLKKEREEEIVGCTDEAEKEDGAVLERRR